MLGSLFTFSKVVEGGWYQTLTLPFFAPPGFLFGPVWVTLYTLMAVALGLVWRGGLKNKERRFLFWFFVGHLVLNAVWSIIFFGGEMVELALLDLVLIIGTLTYFMVRVKKLEIWSFYLLIPYWLWVVFAGVLNAGIWWLN